MKKENILIVNEEESLRVSLSEMVRRIGHDVVTASHGKEALDLLRKGAVTLLIADTDRGEVAINEFVRTVRTEFPDMPIICLVSQGKKEIFSDLTAAGVIDYAVKPVLFEDLRARLNRTFRERNALHEFTQKVVELEIANEELRRLDQLKATFVSGISDELQTPMTVIKEFVSLMLKGQVGSLTDDQREYLGIAHRNILRLSNLVEKLLDFSRVEAGKGLRLKFKPTRLIDVAADAVMALSQQADEKRITLENRLDPDTPLVLIDPSRLMEVFINLIGNGIKFTPPGGKVSIDSRGLTEQRNSLKVVVADTGIGIAPEDMPRIFDRFYQGQKSLEGDRKGTGLGLAISKEIIDGHRGTIDAESKAGAGTSFVFSVPLFNVNAIFDLMIHPMLDEAEKDSIPLSAIQVEFWNQQIKREASFSGEIWETLVDAIQKMVRAVDTIVPFGGSKVYIFTFNDKKLAKEIGKRVQGKLLYGNTVPKKTDVQFKTFSYPQEAPGRDDFLKGCRQMIKED